MGYVNAALKYQIVKNYIVDLIDGNQLSTGERIPSEPELSKKLGVSVITVQRALFELVNEDRIYRVKGKGSFVAEHSSDSGGRKTTDNSMIGFIMSAKQGTQDGSFMSMIRGIQACLGKHGYSLIIEHSNECMDTEKKIINRLIDEGISGIVYFSVDPDKNIPVLKRLREKKIPFVLIDRYAKSYPANCVVSDNFGSIYNIVEYLYSLGHRKIAFITHKPQLSSETDRLDGYRRAMESAGLAAYEDMVFNIRQIDDGRLVSMVKNKEITALIAVNDIVAIEAMKICERNNIAIPGDISITGFDNIEQAAYQKVPLNSIKQYFDMMGSEAAKTLMKIIKSPETACRKIELPTKTVLRKSVSSVE